MAKTKEPTLRQLREQAKLEGAKLELAELQYTNRVIERLSEAAQVVDNELQGWAILSSGSSLATDTKNLHGPGVVTDLRLIRKQSYRMWRLNPHARSIFRNWVKFVIGRKFQVDPADIHRGFWNKDRTKIRMAAEDNVEKPLAVMEVWKDFTKRNNFLRRAKEMVLRAFRDGEVFVRGFSKDGRVYIRFIEPDHVQSPGAAIQTGTVEGDDIKDGEIVHFEVGDKTIIREGIEYLADDIETVVAYHYNPTGTGPSKRIPAHQVIHLKVVSDVNDLRGVPFLEPVLRNLTNYIAWEEYRLILNKVRTAVAFVRKIETGTKSQAEALLAGRLPARQPPVDRLPQTESGRREALPEPGTVLSPGPGVSYEYLAPKLEARDAGEDGRRFLLTIAAGVGQPEMLLTGDYSNSNFASTAEAMNAVQTEWEDWQDFFSPAFQKIFQWVVDAAVEGLGLPEETDREVELGWPTIIVEDRMKATERRATLHESKILSKKTWASEEGLVYDDERENLVEEAEASRQEMKDLGLDPSMFGLDGSQLRLPPQPPPAPGQQPGQPPAGQTPPTAKRQQFKRVQEAMLALASLEEGVAKLNGPLKKLAEDHLAAARQLYLTESESMRVQTLIFDKEKFSVSQAKAWATRHGYKTTKVDATASSIRIRQAAPDAFEGESFRTIAFTDGIKAVVAKAA